MLAAPSNTRMTHGDYLAAEEISPTKHEYVQGEVFAMTRGTPEHSRLAASTSWALMNALRGKPCCVFNSDLRVRVEECDLTSYPDVTVVCGAVEFSTSDRNAVTNPIVLVEVLSPNTEAWDRGDKAAYYRRIPSLREYVLVAQDKPRIELFRRGEAGVWEFCEAGAGEALQLASLGVRLDVDEIYRNPLRDPAAQA